MKPGDFIEWVDELNVNANPKEMLWSTTMNHYVPIGSMKLHLLISNVGGIITWMNDEGLFSARDDDTVFGIGRKVVPRVRG